MLIVNRSILTLTYPYVTKAQLQSIVIVSAQDVEYCMSAGKESAENRSILHLFNVFFD